jgi:hypothetical protein
MSGQFELVALVSDHIAKFVGKGIVWLILIACDSFVGKELKIVMAL